MAFYSFEMVLVGIILLSAMAFGGVQIWRKRRKESENLLAEKNKKLESEKSELEKQSNTSDIL